MSSLWIDSPTYVGPCRRSGRGGMRVFNRRRVGGRGRTPSLATLIRQMRMSDLNYADDQTLVRFRLRFKAAAALAAENNERACAQYLASLSDRIEAATDPRLLSDEAAEILARAAARLS